MNATDRKFLVAETEINAPIATVWQLWNTPDDIMQWNMLSDEWHNTKIENDVRPGGRFLFAMGLKDGSFSFDFGGTYDEVTVNERLTYTLDDGRKSMIDFAAAKTVKLTETFEPNTNDDLEMQLGFCQAVLERFKEYVESKV